MAVGLSRTKADVDQRIGQIMLAFRAVMTDVDRFGQLIDALDDDALTAMGYTAEQDRALLRGVIDDMRRLVAVARGQQVQPDAYDFTARPRLVMGVQ